MNTSILYNRLSNHPLAPSRGISLRGGNVYGVYRRHGQKTDNASRPDALSPAYNYNQQKSRIISPDSVLVTVAG